MPRENAPEHRHTRHAFRFVLEGEVSGRSSAATRWRCAAATSSRRPGEPRLAYRWEQTDRALTDQLAIEREGYKATVEPGLGAVACQVEVADEGAGITRLAERRASAVSERRRRAADDPRQVPPGRQGHGTAPVREFHIKGSAQGQASSQHAVLAA
jgi:hypothetical protein